MVLVGRLVASRCFVLLLCFVGWVGIFGTFVWSLLGGCWGLVGSSFGGYRRFCFGGCLVVICWAVVWLFRCWLVFILEVIAWLLLVVIFGGSVFFFSDFFLCFWWLLGARWMAIWWFIGCLPSCIVVIVIVFWVLGERDFSPWPDTPIAASCHPLRISPHIYRPSLPTTSRVLNCYRLQSSRITKPLNGTVSHSAPPLEKAI